jgi:hypothetical protein
MKKKILILTLILVFATGCAKKNKITVADGQGGFKAVEIATETKEANIQKGDVGNDICQEFTADFVYSATGKTIVKVEPDWIMPTLACRYYFTYDPNYNKNFEDKRFRAGGQLIFMMLENLSVENQKKGLAILDATFKSEPRIKMENMTTFKENGSLRDIRLIINPNRYVRIETNSGGKGITDEELINYAIKVAEKIQGNLPFDIKNNPADTSADTVKPEETGASQQAVASSFLDNLAALKISGALAMMDANENNKQMWGVNFNTIESLKVNKIEEAFKEEWTATRQSFKVELDVKVKPAGEQMGWNQGTNFRWISLEKNTSGVWMIHEIANNP